MEPLGDVANPTSLDPDSLGFMCGLEIHQQLATGKLHTRMPSELYEFGIGISRKTGITLRGAQGIPRRGGR